MSLANNPVRPKLFKKAPLPFVGQKRKFLTEFNKVLLDNIPNQGAEWTIIDVFGGSGLLSNNAKHHLPHARVIYNDFDNYVERIDNISDTNRLLTQIREVTCAYPRNKLLPKQVKQNIISIINNFDGFIDLQSLQSWISFSGNTSKDLDTVCKKSMYNTVRKTNYQTAPEYLAGIDIIKQDFVDILVKYANRDKTLLILDPPYVNTDQTNYANKNYFGMINFLKLMQFVRPPFLFFSSTKSELLDYIEYIKNHHKQQYRRIEGYKQVSQHARINQLPSTQTT